MGLPQKFRTFENLWDRKEQVPKFPTGMTTNPNDQPLCPKFDRPDHDLATFREEFYEWRTQLKHLRNLFRGPIAISCHQYLISTIMWNIERGAPWNANFVSSTGSSPLPTREKSNTAPQKIGCRRSSISTRFLEIKCCWLLPHGWFGAELETIFDIEW